MRIKDRISGWLNNFVVSNNDESDDDAVAEKDGHDITCVVTVKNPVINLSSLAVGVVGGVGGYKMSFNLIADNSGTVDQFMEARAETLCLPTLTDQGNGICAIDYYEDGLSAIPFVVGFLATKFVSEVAANLSGHTKTRETTQTKPNVSAQKKKESLSVGFDLRGR